MNFFKVITLAIFVVLLTACTEEVPKVGQSGTVEFEQLFKEVNGGQYTPIYPVEIGGASMTPGVKIRGSVQFGGLNFESIKDKSIEVENVNGVMVFKSIK